MDLPRTRSGKTTRLAIRALTAGLLVTGLAAGVGATASPASAATKAKPATATATAVTALKPPVQGLLDRHHYPATGYSTAVKAFVVDTSWASIQPTAGGPIVHPNDIDRAITQARTAGLQLKLRVRGGIDAPAWAKTLGGAPVTLYYTDATVAHSGTVAGTVGRFWTPQYGAAYQDLQNKLAAAYDSVPEVRETTINRCATIFTETYLRNTKDLRNAQALLSAGFTRAADDVCHNEQMVAHRAWVFTRSGITFNPYQAIQPNGSVKQDLAYSLAQMTYCRTVLGTRCVLENYSISSSRIIDPTYVALYGRMKLLGAPFDFQTATYAKIGSYTATLNYAALLGASSVELPTGYNAWSAAALAPYASRLAANRTG
jgi:hypothetical protein